jgi:hypothetical protein
MYLVLINAQRDPIEKRPLQIRSRIWEDTIKIDLKELRYKGVDFIHLTQNKEKWWATAVMVVSFGSIKCVSFD